MAPPRRRHTVLDDAEEYEAFDASAPSILPETKPSPAQHVPNLLRGTQQERTAPALMGAKKASNDAHLLRGRSSGRSFRERVVRIFPLSRLCSCTCALSEDGADDIHDSR